MNTPASSVTPIASDAPVTRLDAVVIGAGIAGMYQLHRLRELGYSVRAYESGAGVGGTWYWNRYPGARFDSQSEIYQFWISKDLYASWQPSERFPAQPETERWLNHVADKLDLRKDIQLESRIVSAHFHEDTGRWEVATEHGEKIDAQYVIACTGMLSAPLFDTFPGQSTFKGRICHTSRWPAGPVDLAGKRVGVVGTGATGIQVIQTIASEVGSMKVFMRTRQYITPMRNPKYSKADWDKFVDRYDELKARVQTTFAGFDYSFDEKPWAELDSAQRLEVLERWWADGCLSFWLATFPEMFVDEAISHAVSEFVREKMRARLNHDPKLCEALIPMDYGFGTHRVPLETGYLEAYLRPNVEIVDCKKTPIECIVPEGIRTADGTVHELDVIVLAVGFDAGSGSFARIDFRGRGNRSLREQWSRDITTTMGLQVHGYPNLFMTGAPLAPAAALCNMPTCLQHQVDWITGCIEFARQHGRKVVEAERETEERWVQHHDEIANATLVTKTDSWYMGSNVKGKPRRLLSYIGGVGAYHTHIDGIAASGYPGFSMTSPAAAGGSGGA